MLAPLLLMGHRCWRGMLLINARNKIREVSTFAKRFFHRRRYPLKIGAMLFRRGRRATVARMHHLAGSGHLMAIRYGRRTPVQRVSMEANRLIADYVRELATTPLGA